MAKRALDTVDSVQSVIFSAPPRRGKRGSAEGYRTRNDELILQTTAPTTNPRWNPAAPNHARNVTFHAVLDLYNDHCSVEEAVEKAAKDIGTYPLYYKWEKWLITQDVRRIYAKADSFDEDGHTPSQEEQQELISRSGSDEEVSRRWKKKINPGIRATEAITLLTDHHAELVRHLSLANQNSEENHRSIQPGTISALLSYMVQKMIIRKSSLIVPLGDREVSSATGLSRHGARAMKDMIFSEIGTKNSRAKKSGVQKIIGKVKADELRLSLASLKQIVAHSDMKSLNGSEDNSSNFMVHTQGFFDVSNPLWQGGRYGVDQNVRYLLLSSAHTETPSTDYRYLTVLARKIGHSRSSSYRIAHKAAVFASEIGLNAENLRGIATGAQKITTVTETLLSMEEIGDYRATHVMESHIEEQNAWRGYKKECKDGKEKWVIDAVTRDGWHPSFQVNYAQVGQKINAIAERNREIEKSRKLETLHEIDVLKTILAAAKCRIPKKRNNYKTYAAKLWSLTLNHDNRLARELAECFIIQRDTRLRQADYVTPTTEQAFVSAVMLYASGYNTPGAELLRGYVGISNAENEGIMWDFLEGITYVDEVDYHPFRNLNSSATTMYNFVYRIIRRKVARNVDSYTDTRIRTAPIPLVVERDDRGRPVIAING